MAVALGFQARTRDRSDNAPRVVAVVPEPNTGMTGSFMRRWVLVVTAGETLGFIIPAAVGGVLALASAPGSVVYPLMIAAGACEGMLLGFGQAIGFGPSVAPPSSWVAATAAGAAVAWSVGMLPSTIGSPDFGSPSALPLILIGAVALLVSIPTLQWLVLRRVIKRASWWIPVNAGAWAAGILWTLTPSPFSDENTPFSALLGIYILAGMLMAATVAALTGFAAQCVALSVRPGAGDTGTTRPKRAKVRQPPSERHEHSAQKSPAPVIRITDPPLLLWARPRPRMLARVPVRA